jgi:chemotaxis methyl-accepting protein methylase
MQHGGGAVFARDSGGAGAAGLAGVGRDDPGHGHQRALTPQGGRGYLRSMVLPQITAWLQGVLFTQIAKGRYSIREEIRKRVRFARLNLAQDNWPSLVTGANAMDVILCRNVLMYFSDERADKAAENLLTSLTDAG